MHEKVLAPSLTHNASFHFRVFVFILFTNEPTNKQTRVETSPADVIKQNRKSAHPFFEDERKIMNYYWRLIFCKLPSSWKAKLILMIRLQPLRIFLSELEGSQTCSVFVGVDFNDHISPKITQRVHERSRRSFGRSLLINPRVRLKTRESFYVLSGTTQTRSLSLTSFH